MVTTCCQLQEKTMEGDYMTLFPNLEEVVVEVAHLPYIKIQHLWFHEDPLFHSLFHKRFFIVEKDKMFFTLKWLF